MTDYSPKSTDLCLTASDNGLYWSAAENIFTVDGSLNLLEGYSIDIKNVAYADSPVTLVKRDPILTCVNATSGNVVINLPPASANKQIYWIKKTDVSANTVTVTPNGSDTIEGSATKVLTAQYSSIQLVSNGTIWLVLYEKLS